MKNILISLYAFCLQLMQKAAVNLKVTQSSMSNRMRGATALEYVMIVAVISIVIIVAITQTDFLDRIGDIFNKVDANLAAPEAD